MSITDATCQTLETETMETYILVESRLHQRQDWRGLRVLHGFSKDELLLLVTQETEFPVEAPG